MQQLLQAAQHITVAGFCAAPTAAGLRALAAAGSERLKKMIEVGMVSLLISCYCGQRIIVVNLCAIDL